MYALCMFVYTNLYWYFIFLYSNTIFWDIKKKMFIYKVLHVSYIIINEKKNPSKYNWGMDLNALKIQLP